MQYISFSDAEKIKLFDEIASHFYNANFGQLSKSDMELMMFRFYMDKMISENTGKDGTLDYNKCSDYRISKDLGITQQRVRSLKIKNQLTHPVEFDWKKAFATQIENARFDQDTHKVTINIPDPNLYLEIQNYLEEHGGYVEVQLNSKVLQIRAEYFIQLIVAAEPEENRKKIIHSLRKQFKDAGKENANFDELHLGKTICDGAVNLTTIAANISSIVSPENLLAKAFISLLTK